MIHIISCDSADPRHLTVVYPSLANLNIIIIILYMEERAIEQRPSRTERSDRMSSQPIPYDLSRRVTRPNMAEPAGSAVAGTHIVQEDSPAKISAAVANFVRAVTPKPHHDEREDHHA